MLQRIENLHITEHFQTFIGHQIIVCFIIIIRKKHLHAPHEIEYLFKRNIIFHAAHKHQYVFRNLLNFNAKVSSYQDGISMKIFIFPAHF